MKNIRRIFLIFGLLGLFLQHGGNIQSQNSDQAMLTVRVLGQGSAKIISSPPGIECNIGEECLTAFQVNTPVTLRVERKGDDDTTFIGWKSVTGSAIACAGSPGDCSLILVQDSTAHAAFGLSSEDVQLERNDPIVVNAVKEPEVIASMMRTGTCCFSNATYVGACTVTIAAGETCSSMLDYLNTPGTSGKAYCGQTQLRGGWQQIDCP